MKRIIPFALVGVMTAAVAAVTPVVASSIPPAAAEAGFNTVALDSDFTRRLPKNWLGGCPNGADGSPTNTSDNTGHVWYNNTWWKSQANSCDVKQVTDPKYGGTVLDLAWRVHFQRTPGGDGHIIQSAGWNNPLPKSGSPSVGFAAPNNAYYEIIARVEPLVPSNVMNFVTWAVTGITGGDPGIEWDVMEIGGDGGGDAADPQLGSRRRVRLALDDVQRSRYRQ